MSPAGQAPSLRAPPRGRAETRATEYLGAILVAVHQHAAAGGTPGELLVIFGPPSAVAAAVRVAAFRADPGGVLLASLSLRGGVRAALEDIAPAAAGPALLAVARAPRGATPLLWVDGDGFDASFLAVGPQ